MDVVGDIASASATLSPTTPDRVYQYDALYRLKAANTGTSSPLEAYTYSKTGDRQSASLNGGAATSYTYAAGTHRIETDHLGTPRQVVRPSTNTAIWKWDFLQNTFGSSTPNQDPDGDGAGFVFNRRFLGQYYDAESGLHYNYFRDYEPTVGRYAESDPLGLRGESAAYSYVLSRPTMRVDPLGLISVSLGGEAGFHIPGTGGLGAASCGMDSDGKICCQVQMCGRLGMGVGAGGGPRVSVGPNFEEGQDLQASVYGEGGLGGMAGASIGDGGISINIGPGAEVCGGIQTCPVRTKCFFDLDWWW